MRSRCRVFLSPLCKDCHRYGRADRISPGVRPSFRFSRGAAFCFSGGFFFSLCFFCFFGFFGGLGTICIRTGPAAAVTRSSLPKAMRTPTRRNSAATISASSMPSIHSATMQGPPSCNYCSGS